MTRFDPRDLEEEPEPRRWPLALIGSVLLHAAGIAAVAAALWPEQTSLSSDRDGPLLVMRGSPSSDAIVAPLATAERSPSPTPATAPQPTSATPAKPPEDARVATLPPVRPPVEPLRRPVTQVEAAPAPPMPPLQVEPVQPAPPVQAVAVVPPPPQVEPRQPASRAVPARRGPPTWQGGRSQRVDLGPSFDSAGQWFRAMSRMRHGDFAPHRGD